MFWDKKEDSKLLPDLPALPNKIFPVRTRNEDLDESDEDLPREKNPLPSFPDSPLHNKISEVAIKDAIENLPNERIEFDTPEKTRTVEMEEWTPHVQNGLPQLKRIEQGQEDLENENLREMRDSELIPSMPQIRLSQKNQEEFEDKRKLNSFPDLPSTPSQIVPPSPYLNSYQRPIEKKSPQEDIFVKIDKFRSVRKTLNETKMKIEEIDSYLKKIREMKLREEQELNSWEKDITNTKARIQQILSEVFEKVD